MGLVDPHGPGPGRHHRRAYADRLSRLRLPESGLGSKIGLDATNKWPPETHREWGQQIRMDAEMVDTVTRKWAQYGLPGSGKPIWR